ncbi:hypothetical protein [Serratia silvae]|uniref:Uncharacterized protein n=1 Tax=Serratia silvae TaxID=2824122 RepID=A0ABT0KH91_9GAMM|nr:hypothetical protein [Serratia silvae]MCL1031394.1 hypothetical protein [Serratia silvae]
MTLSTGILSNPHLMTILNPQQKEVAQAFFSPGENRKIVVLTGPTCGMSNKITNIAVANLIDKRRTTIVVSNKAGKFGPIVISALNQVLPKDEPLVQSGNLIFQRHDARPRVVFVTPRDFTDKFATNMMGQKLPIDIIFDGLGGFSSNGHWQQIVETIYPDTILICDEPLVLNGEKALVHELATSEEYHVLHLATKDSPLLKPNVDIHSFIKAGETENDFHARLKGTFA